MIFFAITCGLNIKTLPPEIDQPNLFFSIDGINPIDWTGIDYVDQCFRVDGDDTLIRGIGEATTYINATYPGQTLNAADGTWDGPASGVIMVHDATLLMTIETTTNNEEVFLPIITQPGTTNNIINWGDGSPDEILGVVSVPTHVYTTASQYQITVCADLTQFNWVGTSTVDRQSLISIDQWGDTGATAASFGRSSSIASIDSNISDSITSLADFLSSSTANPDLTNLDTSNVQSFLNMFDSNPSVTPNTTLWNTSSATDMTLMFNGATLANPDVSNWDVSNVVSFSSMFFDADSAIPDVSSWITSSGINMSGMFAGTLLADPDVSGWDVSNVTDMASMFLSTSVADPDVSLWNTSSATDMSFMFSNSTAANPDVSGWDLSSVLTISNMFSSSDVATPDTSLWVTSSITNMSNVFLNADAANPNVSSWNVSNVINMSGMFNNADLANPDVSLWNVGAVTDMSSLFRNTAIANPDVSGWDVSNVAIFTSMFSNADSAIPNTSLWITSSATDMRSMFSLSSLTNPDVSGWDVSTVTNFANMFDGSPNANPDVSSWDIQSMTNILQIFRNSGITTANYDQALVQFNAIATLNSIINENMGTVPANFTIATSGAARTNLVGPLGWTITDNGGI